MKKKIIYALASVTTLVYVIWRIGWSLPTNGRVIDIVFAIILLVAELLGFLEAVNYMAGSSKPEDIEQPVIPLEEYPDVDIFIATYNEETELLRKTVNGCINMDYPDKNKVHVFICDDNDRPEMAALAKEMGVGYFRRDDHKGAKAGNLNNALAHTTSPLVTTFDADMIPMHDFLMTVVPYFFMYKYKKDSNGNWVKVDRPEKRMGFVQTPQNFYNADLFQYNLFAENAVPNEQEFFFKTIQLGRNKANASIYAGSNTVLTREALNDVGGIYEGAITEDMATGLRIQAKGYRTLSLKSVHASGLSPTDIKSLFKQRARWARGCIQTFRQMHLLRTKGLTWRQKREYIASLVYWYTPLRRVVFLLSPILFTVFGIHMLDCTMKDIMTFWLPHYVFYSLALKQFAGNMRSGRLSNIYDTILSFWLIPGVIMESFGIKKSKFEVTKKNKQRDENSMQERLRYAAPYIICLALSIIGCIISIYKTLKYETMGYSVIFFWSIVNVYVLAMSIFFIIGRVYHRETERFDAQISATIDDGDRVREVKTKDISEGGCSFVLDKPEYIDVNKVLNIVLIDENDRYKSNVTGKLLHVRHSKEGWIYSIQFDLPEGRDLLQLYQIVYDRVPTLPNHVNHHSSFFEDSNNNIVRRREEEKTSDRKYARAFINKELVTKDGDNVKVIDFDYDYISLRSENGKYKKEVTVIDEENGLTYECQLEKVLHVGHSKKVKKAIYKLVNRDAYIVNERFETLLAKWDKEARDSIAFKKKVARKNRRFSPYEFNEEALL